MIIQTALRHIGAGSWLVALIALAAIFGETQARAQGDKVVMTINNESVTEAEYFHRLQLVKGSDFLLPTNPPTMRSENAGYIVLNSIIIERLILQLAAKENLTPTEAEINVELGPLMKQDNVVKALAEHVVLPEDLKYDVKYQVARYNLATNRQVVTQAEIESFYKEHADSFKTPERWGLSAIRTSKIDDAVKVINDLKAGKTFEETARTYSEDERTKAIGGKIGAFDANDKGLPPDIRKAVSTLRQGEYTQPVMVTFDPGNGAQKVPVYWIVKLTAKQEATTHQLADVKAQVERLTALQKSGGLDKADTKVAEFRKTSDIKVNLPGYSQLESKPKT